MGAFNPLAPPAADDCAADPVDGTTSDCPFCWTADLAKEISVKSYGRYSQPFKKDGSKHGYTDLVEYKLIAPFKSGKNITVEVRFKIEPQAGVSAVDVAAARTKLEKGINIHWNGTFELEANDPVCGKKKLNIRYKAVSVSSGQHYTMKVHKTFAREGVDGNILNVAQATDDWTYAHEFAHCFGLPDEYSYTTDTETVKYFKPDGTLDAAINAPPDGKSKTAADATIMSAVDNTKILERHGWHIAIEIQEMLKAELGRDVPCTIKVKTGKTVSPVTPKKPVPLAWLPGAADKILLQEYLVHKKPGLKSGPYDLGDFGPDGDGVDGIIGGNTKAALIQFQKDHGGLDPDGIYGPLSADAFDEEINGS